MIILYQAYIPVQTNKLTISRYEFTETKKQFRSIGDRPFIISKDKNDNPTGGYARTPGEAIEIYRNSIRRAIEYKNNELAELYTKLNIIEKTSIGKEHHARQD